MQILKTYDFISERVKIKPITNAEWDKTKKDMIETMRLFDDNTLKSKLKEFDIVKTFFSASLYLIVKNPDLISTLNLDVDELNEGLKEGMALYYHGSGDVGFSYLFLSKYDENLRYYWTDSWDIYKIYRRNTNNEVKVYNAKDLMDVASTKSLKMLQNHFKLIFER